MKKILMTLAVALFATSAMAQITFTSGNFDAVKKAAASSNKLIFMDVYTTWCGPCKYLAANIFPAKSVGDYVNSKFLSTQVDAEAGEGVEIARKYNVANYPTILILDATGTELARLVGSSKTPDEYLERIKAEMTKLGK